MTTSTLTHARNAVIADGPTLIIRFRYSPERVDDVRRITGRKWNPQRKEWTAPMSSAVEVKAFADAHGIPFLTDAPAGEDQPLVVSRSGSSLLLTFGYHPTLIERVRELPGATWSNHSNGWLVDLEAAIEVAELVERGPSEVTTQAKAVLDDAHAALRRIEMSKATDSDFEVPGFGVDLYPFQRAGIEYACQVRNCIIADEPGLGKTRQALGVLHMTEAFPALIVVPAVSRINWRREATNALPGRTVEILKGVNPQPRLDWPDVTIVSWDAVYAHVDYLPELKGFVADESHLAKNPQARRTKASYVASDKVVDNGITLCLSGTPVLNGPKELIPQLRIARLLGFFGGASGFTKRYGKANNLGELNRRLRSVGYVRRRKEEVLKDLPPKVWADVVVEGDPKIMAQYRKAEADIVEYLAEKARRLAASSGASVGEQSEAAWRAAMRASAAEHLVAITALKQLAAQAKMKAAHEWIDDFLGSGKKLVTFGWHRDIVNTLADRFAGGAKVQGGMSDAAKQQWIDAFQEDDDQKVISCQIKAAGVAITLTAASDVLFLEQGWTPADMDQASDRCHRIGQVDSVTAWNMICEGTIDEDFAELIAAKRRIVDAATDGKDPEEDQKQSVLGDLVVRLAERGLAGH
jgi:SNF2 family DNA or RNA helicase